MSDQTTSAGASGDAGTTEPDYRSKYDGLQSAFQKRQNQWARQEQTHAALKAEHEAALAELQTFRSSKAAEEEEANLEAQYEALRERLEPEAPTPRSHNSTRERVQKDDGTYAGLKRSLGIGASDSKAWPV
jgi:chromosome segregation ATPase